MIRGYGAAFALACALACMSIALTPASSSAETFRRFVACDTCISDFYYADEGDFFPQDWSCSDSTYDGHVGTDFSLRNGNAAIDNGNEIVAAAAGTVISTEDGYYDRCTRCGGESCGYDFGNGFGNQVYIDHGSHVAMYGHMRNGSVAVQPGQAVTCGQVIGEIGSAGCSTGAHVHFEPRTPGTEQPVDPYEGDCSATSPSLWVAQGAHRTLPATTCDGSPPTPTCPAQTYPIWTCSSDLSERRRCIDGVDTREPCSAGCTVMPSGTDDICALPADADGDASRADVDCDDTDAAIHPGAIDACGDAIDQDCSGADAMCPVTGTGGASGIAASGGTSGAAGIAGAMAGDGSLNAGTTGAPAGAPTGAAGDGLGMSGASGGAAGISPGLAGALAAPPPRRQAVRGCGAAPNATTRSPFCLLLFVVSAAGMRRARRNK